MTEGWFPGHMARTRRLIRENLRLVRVVLEVVDARVPASGRNPDLTRLIGGKRRFVVLNKADLAEPRTTKEWLSHLRSSGAEAFEADSRSGRGCKELMKACIDLGRARGPTRLMVVGIPNSGKSTLLNRLVGRHKASSGPKPGVTRGKQWATAPGGLEVLDLPGVLSPRKGGSSLLKRLAAVGALDEKAYDIQDIALFLLGFPGICQGLRERYELELAGDPLQDLATIGRRLGCLAPGGEIDLERASAVLVREFQGGNLGRHTLESPVSPGE